MQAHTFTPRSQLVIKPSLRTSLPCTFAARPTKHYTLRASSAAGSAPIPEEEPSTSAATSPTDVSDTDSSSGFQKLAAWWKEKQAKSADLRKRLVSLGPAAVLAYGSIREFVAEETNEIEGLLMGPHGLDEITAKVPAQLPDNNGPSLGAGGGGWGRRGRGGNSS